MARSKFPAYFCNDVSNYHAHGGFDVFTKDRKAEQEIVESPAVYHPPCAQWGRLKAFARVDPAEKALALWALDMVQNHGGVLEHPRSTSLLRHIEPSARHAYDSFNGFLISVNLSWFGFPAEKKTVLYIVGITRSMLPVIPYSLDAPIMRLGSATSNKEALPKNRRSETPPAMVAWIHEVLELIMDHRKTRA